MQSLAFLLVLFSLLASRALAFTVTVGSNKLGVADLLAIPDGPVKQACAPQCNQANQVLSACNGDANCLCSVNTVSPLQICEQCMYTVLIKTNKPLPDFRAGSTPVLAAYSTECKNQTGNALDPASIALAVPPSWDGPFVGILPFGVAIIYAIFGGFIGISGILILCNM